MTSHSIRTRILIPAVMLAAWVSGASASGLSPAAPSIFGFNPKVPISALAQPTAWFDPSRMHLSTSLSFGSGFGGASEGLQVTSLSYQFKAPMWMKVNVGNTWGASARGSNSMFLEGLDFGARPFGNFQVQVHYRDLRSPLQYPAFDRPYGWGE